VVFASVTGMVGIFWMRYDLVDDTQLAPMLALKTGEYLPAPGLTQYTPTTVEWMISIGAIGLAFAIYYAANKFFDLDHKV